MRVMPVPGWLEDTRTSYDTVAVSYADLLRDALAGEPFQRGILALFAELVRAEGGGPVADVGCGPGRLTWYPTRVGNAGPRRTQPCSRRRNSSIGVRVRA